MSVINQVVDAVLPQLSEAGQTLPENEQNLVTDLAKLMAVKLAGQEQEPSVDASSDGVTVIGALFDTPESRGELLTKLSETHGVDQTKTQNLVANSAPLILGQFSALSGNRSVTSFLTENLSTFKDKLPAWGLSLLPAGLLGAASGAAQAGEKLVSDTADKAQETAAAAKASAAAAVSKVTAGTKAATNQASQSFEKAADEAKAAGSKVGKALWPILGLIVLLAAVLWFLKACQGESTQAQGAAALEQAQNLAPASLTLIGSDLAAAADAVSAGEQGAEAVDSEVAAGSQTAQGSADATGLTLGGLTRCFGQTGSEVLAQSLKKTVASVFADQACTELSVDQGVAQELPAAKALPDVLNALKSTAGLSARLEGAKVAFGGPKAQAMAHVEALAETHKDLEWSYTDALLGGEFDLSSPQDAAMSALESTQDGILEAEAEAMLQGADPEQANQAEQEDSNASNALSAAGLASAAGTGVANAVNKSLQNAEQALGSMGANATAEQLAKALNMQIINFSSGGSSIPADNQAVLNQAANVLKANPSLKLSVTGHTDSTGSEAANVALSTKRAQAVKAYLVSAGAAESQLSARGVGSAEPVASNDTAEGRFQNRRIQFAAK